MSQLTLLKSSSSTDFIFWGEAYPKARQWLFAFVAGTFSAPNSKVTS